MNLSLAYFAVGTRVRRSASLVLLFAGTLGLVQAQAHPLSDDCTPIREALQALPPLGGEVAIASGTYICSSPIILANDNVTLRGVGRVVLRLADNVNSPLLVMGKIETPPAPTYNVNVINLELDGNRLNQQSECWGGACDAGGTAYIRNNGISVRAIINGSISKVVANSHRSGGVVTEKGCHHLRVDDLTASDNHFDGFAGYETFDSTFTRLNLSHNQAAGISIDIRFNGNVFSDSVLEGNGDVGIFMRDSQANRFENLQIIESGNHGIFLSQADDESSCANDNVFHDLTVANSKGVAFRLNNACHGNRLTGTARFKNNRDGCISEGSATPLEVSGELICEN